MSDLVEFLRARLDQDEKAAGLVTEPIYACDGHDRRWDCIAQPEEKWADGSDRLPNHHATWEVIYDPARVLAEVAAKRARLDALVNARESHKASPSQSRTLVLSLHDWHARLDAAVYALHPDYREEWKP